MCETSNHGQRKGFLIYVFLFDSLSEELLNISDVSFEPLLNKNSSTLISTYTSPQMHACH